MNVHLSSFSSLSNDIGLESSHACMHPSNKNNVNI